MRLPSSIQNLIDEFSRLPGIGPKTSQRLVFSLLKRPKSQIEFLIKALSEFKSNVHLCNVCFNFANSKDGALCKICSDSGRDKSVICVVADSMDLIAIESAGYKGVYHIIGGVINPLKGIKPDNLRIRQLINRISKENVEEIILAFDPNQEGELTCRYIKDALSNYPIKITRLARGLPQGGDLDYADEITLKEAINGRREI